MDRLRVMSGARRLFNGPLTKTRASGAQPADRRASLPRGRCAVAASSVRAFGTTEPSRSSSGQIILESPFGPANPVEGTLPEYIWRNADKWEDKPMIL